jgi:hypothetical protein
MNSYPPELRALELELIASFTPQQRYLAKTESTGLDATLTPYQRGIMERMKPYQVGVTPEQARRAAYQDQIQIDWQKGWDQGQRDGAIIGRTAWIVAIALLLLFIASRC